MNTKELEKLGNILVKEYGLENSVNTLERWMLHYLAELFDQEKNCEDKKQKKSIQIDIKEIILDFWSLRYNLSDAESIFKKNQILVNTLERISTKSLIPCYPYKQSTQNSSTTEWGNKLIAIDQASKILMSHCILKDLSDITDKNEEMVELLKFAESIDSPESILVRFVSIEKEEADKVENIKKRIEDLKNFIATAEIALEEYKDKLNSISDDLESTK